MRIINFTLTIAVFIIVPVLQQIVGEGLFAQAPNWQWAQTDFSTFYDYGSAIATDNNGNICVTGTFSGNNTSFGSVVVINSDPQAETQVFTVKYAPNGNVLWARAGIGDNWQQGQGIATDAGGNVYITGVFRSPSITFDTVTVFNTDPTGEGYAFFIAKYDPNGNILWAKSAGGPALDELGNWMDEGFGIATTSLSGGAVYALGAYGDDTISFGSTTITGGDIFLVKYDLNGNLIWARSSGESYQDYANRIAADVNGNLYIAGAFVSQSISFGSVVLNKIDTTSNNSNAFVVKYDPNGNAIWARSAGANSAAGCVSTDNTAAGNLYITGSYTAGPITFGSTTLYDSSAFFITKYDSSGNALWAEATQFTGSLTGIVSNPSGNGNFWITGNFESPSATFGSTTLNNIGSGGYDPDIFVAGYDLSGNALWATSADGIYWQMSNGVAADANSNVYITGEFGSTDLFFGSIGLAKMNNGDSTDNFFIAKLGNTSGIHEVNNTDNKVAMYPNPGNGKIQLSSTNAAITRVDIYNALGEQEFEREFDNAQLLTEIDLSNLPAGVFVVNIGTEQGNLTQKYILMK